MMKRQAIMMAALLALAAAPGAAQQGRVVDDGWCREDRSNSNREQACEVREVTLLAGASQVAVDAAPNGGIQVVGSARRDVVVRAKVTASAESQARAREILAGVRVDAAPDRIAADGPQGLDRRESWSVSYRLAVPTQTSLQLKTTNGGISIDSVDGRLEFATVNGGVKLAGVSGEVHGRTSNGGVDVDLDGATWQGEGLDVETSNGGVRLRIPEQYSARLEAGTVNGGISIDFPITLQGRIDREIAASLGAGGPLIRVRTHNGGVRVTRK
jgi:Putative adhesin